MTADSETIEKNENVKCSESFQIKAFDLKANTTRRHDVYDHTLTMLIHNEIGFEYSFPLTNVNN